MIKNRKLVEINVFEICQNVRRMKLIFFSQNNFVCQTIMQH